MFKYLLSFLLLSLVHAQFDFDICKECVKDAADGCTFCLKEDSDGGFISVCSCDQQQVAELGDCTDADWLLTTQRYIGCEMMENKRTTEAVAIALIVSIVLIFCIGLCVVLQFCYGCITCSRGKKKSSAMFKSTNDLEMT